MEDSTALVPVPFYPPVRSAANAWFKFNSPSRRPWPGKEQVRAVVSKVDAGVVYYTSNGLLMADVRVGTLVNIYI